MLPGSTAAVTAGARVRPLFASGASAEATAATAERLLTHLAGGLSRWFGSGGSRELMARALAAAVVQHPVLTGVLQSEARDLAAFAVATERDGADAMIEGVFATVSGVVALIARLIGDDLALRLFEQATMMSSTTAPATSEPAVQGIPQPVTKS